MKTLFLGVVAILLVVAGCDDDSDCVNCVSDWRPLIPSANLKNIWPNADGTSWEFDHVARLLEGSWILYPTKDAVPKVPVPDWSMVAEVVSSAPSGDALATETGTFTLTFDGTITTQSQVTAQNLREELVVDYRSGFDLASTDCDRAVIDRARTVRTLLTRPDGAPAEGSAPIMIHGGPWKRTSSLIATYSDGSALPAWTFLTSALRVGSTFSQQLIPWLARDVYLHGVVYRQISVETEVGTFKKALDCLYVIEYGLTTVTNAQGEAVGYVRTIDCGRVIYVPNLGPVYSYERYGIQPERWDSDGFFDVTEVLAGTSLVKR
jgi:hypothetical protein